MGAQSTLNTGLDKLPPELLGMIFKEIYHGLPRVIVNKANDNLSTTTSEAKEDIDDLMATTWKVDTQSTWPIMIKQDLKSCSLVCRRFNALVTHLLFRDLCFRFSPVSTPRNVTSIIEFLKTRREAVGQSIRTLFIEGDPEMERTDAQELLRLLHMLPQLRRLVLDRLPITFSEAPSLNVCPTLDDLSINFSGRDNSQRDYSRLMHCFGKIKTLTIAFMGCVPPSRDDETIPYYKDVALQIRPRHIIFEGMFQLPMDLIDNLHGNPEVANAVTALQINQWDSPLLYPGAYEEARVFLNYFKTVTHLAIGISDGDYVVYNPAHPNLISSRVNMDLSSFIDLTHLELNHSLAFYDPTTCRNLLTELTRCIEYITVGPALRRLDLYLRPIKKSKYELREITLKEAMEGTCEALEDHPLAEVLDMFAFTNRCKIGVYVVLPSVATTAQETVGVSLLGAIFSKRSKESSDYLELGVWKGDEFIHYVNDPETGAS